MATKDDLLGSLGSLIDTLRGRIDPWLPNAIFTRASSLMLRAAAITRSDAWDGLPSNPPGGQAVVAALDTATRTLVTANYENPASVNSALNNVDSALDRLENLLGI